MAGLGERFKFAGYKDPKPLIPIDGKPVIEHIVQLFPGVDKIIFVCNENHLKETPLQSELARIAPNATIVSIPEHRLGPVYTTLQAKEFINDDEPVITCYCDINVHWNFGHLLAQMTETDADAGLVVFKGFHPPLLQDGYYATARTEDGLHALEVREKYSFTPDKMDSWTSAGIHYFKSGRILKKAFEGMIEQEILCNNEYYISLSHKFLIDKGYKNVLYPIEYFISWGKPDDVMEYQYWSKYFNS